LRAPHCAGGEFQTAQEDGEDRMTEYTMPKQVFDALGVILDSTGHRDFLSRPNYCSLLCPFGLLAEWHNDPT
jgi:hypothetical protein